MSQDFRGKGQIFLGIFFGFHKTRHIVLSDSANCTVLRAVVLAYGRGQTDTDTQTRVTTIPFASSMTHAKCNQAYSEYKHVLANILRSLFVARTPSEEARSPCRRSNVENASVTCWSLISNAHAPRVN